MSKLAIALVSVMVALAFAAEEAAAQEGCQKELIGRSIDRCRSWLWHGEKGMMAAEADDNQEAPPQECCEQLGQVSENCRCELINNMVREVAWERGHRAGKCRGQCREMATKAETLPAMCKVAPQKCSIDNDASGVAAATTGSYY